MEGTTKSDITTKSLISNRAQPDFTTTVIASPNFRDSNTKVIASPNFRDFTTASVYDLEVKVFRF